MCLTEKVNSVVYIIDLLLSHVSQNKISNIPRDASDLELVLNHIKSKLKLFLNENLCLHNQKITMIYLESILKYLRQLHISIKDCKANLTDEQKDNLIIFYSKLVTFSDFLDVIPKIPKDDLFSLEKSHERWESLNQITEQFHKEKAEQIKKKYHNLMCKISMIQAFIPQTHQELPSTLKYLTMGMSPLYYFFSRKKSLRKLHLLYAKPKLETAIHIWNLLETKTARSILELVSKSIKFNKVIYIPRTVSEITENHFLKKTDPNYSFKQDGDRVMIRILNSSDLPAFTKNTIETTYQKSVFHIHGGGFMSMSSASHQAYTNIWAKDLGVPIFSVDYRLAPKYKFPKGLDDIWQTWNWLLNHAENQIGITPKNYVIVGDSAGGNLALGLLYKIINLRLPLPNGIVLAYPALNLNKNHFTPSYLHSFEDLLIPHTFLKLCLEAYLKETDNTSDPLMSPINTEDEVFKQFPPVRLIVGTEDPLYDDCFRFAEKLIKNRKDVKIAEFFGSPHGGLNFCVRGGVKEAKEMVAKASNWIKELLNSF